MNSHQIINAQKELEKRRKLAGVDASVTDVVSSPAANGQPANDDHMTPSPAGHAPTLPEQCRIIPTIALAFLERFPAVGRHYFLLRNYDREYQNGRGIVDRDIARELLKDVCTWRRTLQILKQGQGAAWDTENGYIRLFSPAKVSLELNAGYLRGDQVIVPTAKLTGGIQQVNSTFYNTVHTTCKLQEDQKKNPIGRAKLEEMTGVKPRSQYDYDKLEQTDITKNVHLLDAEWSDTEKRHDAAVKYGYVFPIYDRKRHKKVIGRPMPNSYSSELKTVRYGRKKRVNRTIRDNLLQNAGTGKFKEKRVTIFYPDENGALTSFNRDSSRDRYWRQGTNTITTINRPCRLLGVDTWRMVEGVSV